jgi:hypothetical protein
MKRFILCFAFVLPIFGFSQVISTEAPSVSASAVNVPKNHFQVEASFGFYKNDEHLPIENWTVNAPFVLLRYGLFDKFELRATSSYEILGSNMVETRHVFTNFGLGGKYEILDSENSTNLAFIAHYTSINYFDWQHGASGTIAFSQSIADRHSIGANLGFQWQSYDAIPNYFHTFDHLASVVYSFGVFDNLTAFGEFFGSLRKHKNQGININPPDEISYGVDFGLQYLLTDKIQLDYVSKFSLTSKEQFHAVGFNILLNTKK